MEELYNCSTCDHCTELFCGFFKVWIVSEEENDCIGWIEKEED